MTPDLPCFAYGANLCTDVLVEHLVRKSVDADDRRPVGHALLPDHALAFDTGPDPDRPRAGALDLVARRGSVVQGVLIAPTARAWAALDCARDVSDGARAHRHVEVVMSDGSLRAAVVCVPVPARRPAHGTAEADDPGMVERGYERWGFDAAPLRSALRGGDGALDVDAVFVYGTLLRGEANAHVLHGERARPALAASIRGSLHETGEPYPVMRLDGASVVHGELVELDDVEAALGPLDALEGFGGYGRADRLYHRTLVQVATGVGTRLAWTYVAGETLAPGARIEGGDWRAHRAGRAASRNG
jgi:gamma-glutamylcyclotransferase (GGCT)/AIG2-like uncharacterized protein YtfP